MSSPVFVNMDTLSREVKLPTGGVLRVECGIAEADIYIDDVFDKTVNVERGEPLYSDNYPVDIMFIGHLCYEHASYGVYMNLTSMTITSYEADENEMRENDDVRIYYREYSRREGYYMIHPPGYNSCTMYMHECYMNTLRWADDTYTWLLALTRRHGGRIKIRNLHPLYRNKLDADPVSEYRNTIDIKTRIHDIPRLPKNHRDVYIFNTPVCGFMICVEEPQGAAVRITKLYKWDIRPILDRYAVDELPYDSDIGLVYHLPNTVFTMITHDTYLEWIRVCTDGTLTRQREMTMIIRLFTRFSWKVTVENFAAFLGIGPVPQEFVPHSRDTESITVGSWEEEGVEAYGWWFVSPTMYLVFDQPLYDKYLIASEILSLYLPKDIVDCVAQYCTVCKYIDKPKKDTEANPTDGTTDSVAEDA